MYFRHVLHPSLPSFQHLPIGKRNRLCLWELGQACTVEEKQRGHNDSGLRAEISEWHRDQRRSWMLLGDGLVDFIGRSQSL